MSSRSLCCSISLLGLAAMAVPMGFADDYRISGPYTHDNTTIFMIHGAAKALKLAARSTTEGQTKVWSEVEKSNRKAAASAGYASGAPPSPSPTSMQMARADKHVSEKTDAYIRE